jgi:hypothetical protein
MRLCVELQNCVVGREKRKKKKEERRKKGRKEIRKEGRKLAVH